MRRLRQGAEGALPPAGCARPPGIFGSRGRTICALLAGWLAGAATAQEAPVCRQALVLAIDVSASVDAREYRLQAGGLARALMDASVRQAFLEPAGTAVALAVFEWSGPGEQRLVVDWTMVTGDDVLDRVAATLESLPVPAQQSTTAIGAAMLAAADLFARGPDCLQRTLDISGDGQNNDAPPPGDARHAPGLAGVTINGLVIGADFPRDHALNPNRMGALARHYAARVIKGPGAFVEEADDFRDFEAAMRRKLIRELNTMVLGAVGP